MYGLAQALHAFAFSVVDQEGKGTGSLAEHCCNGAEGGVDSFC